MKALRSAVLCGVLVSIVPPTVQAQEAIEVWGRYTAEAWRNVAGGARVGGVYLDKVEAGLSLDGEKAFGWRGFSLAVAGMQTNADQLSEPLVGDIHTASNIDAPRLSALQEAWVEQVVGPLGLKVGVIDLNSEFDVNEVGSLFINSAHGIGPEFSQAGQTGPSIFPTPGLAARLRLELGDWGLAAGAFDGQPGDPTRARQDLRLRDGDGALYTAEVERVSEGGGRWRIGGWRHTGVTADGGSIGRGEGAYVLIEPRPWQWNDRRVSTFARFGVANGADLPIIRYLGMGAVIDPAAGERGQLGLALALSDYRPEHAPGDKGREAALELTYRRQLTSWLAVQPNLQWVSRPGGRAELDSAWVVGLRLAFFGRHPLGASFSDDRPTLRID